MRSISRRLLGAFVAAATVTGSGTALVAVHLSAAASTAPPAYTLRGVHAMRARGVPDNIEGVGVPVGERMVYGGGAIQTSPKVYITYWDWSSDPAGVRPYLEGFFGGVGGSNWISSQDQYCQHVQATAVDCSGAAAADHINTSGQQLAGTWSDTGDPIPTVPNPNSGFTNQVIEENSAGDSPPIADEAARAIAHFGFDPSAQYIIATPTGVSTAGFASNGGSYCAWHGSIQLANGGQIASFTNLPYMPDAGPSCGAGLLGSPLDGVSIVGGHEYAESMTDPDPFATSLFGATYASWGDPVTGETGDKCAWMADQTLGGQQGGPGDAADITLPTGRFAVQSLWANDANNYAGGCVTQYSPPTVAAPSQPVAPGTAAFNPSPAACAGAQVQDVVGDAVDPYVGTDVINTYEPSLDLQSVLFTLRDPQTLEITWSINNLQPFPQADVVAGAWSVYWSYGGSTYVATVSSDATGTLYADGVHQGTTGTPADAVVGSSDIYANVDDSGSFNPGPNGTVVIDVPFSHVGNPPAGAVLSSPYAVSWGTLGTPNAFNAAEPILPILGGDGQSEFFASDLAPDGNPFAAGTNVGADYTLGAASGCSVIAPSPSPSPTPTGTPTPSPSPTAAPGIPAPTFNPSLQLPGSGGIAEPGLKYDAAGNAFAIAPAAAPLGCRAFKVAPAGNSAQYLGLPDRSAGGGDCDLSVGPVETAPTTGTDSSIAFSSLELSPAGTGFNIGTGKSDDGGATFTPVNAFSQQVADDDRMWMYTDPQPNPAGLADVFMTYHDPDNEIQLAESVDGGQTYVNAGPFWGLTSLPNVITGGIVFNANNELGNITGLRTATGLTLYSTFVSAAPGTSSPLDTVYEAIGAVGDPTGAGVPSVTWNLRRIYTDPSGANLNSIFPATAVDAAGGIYTTWSTGTHVFVTGSNDGGSTWSSPVAVDTAAAGAPAGENAAVMPWIAAGGPGDVDVVWYASHGGAPGNPGDAADSWDAYLAQTASGGAGWTAAKVSDRPIHSGAICLGGSGCSGGRTLLDFFQVAVDPVDGAAGVVYADDHLDGDVVVDFTRQCTGLSLTTGKPLTNDCAPPASPAVPGTSCPGPQVTDETGDALNTYLPTSDGSNIPSLDLTQASWSLLDSKTLRVTITLNNLSAPPYGNLPAGQWDAFWNFNGRTYYAQAALDAVTGSGSPLGNFSDGTYDPAQAPQNQFQATNFSVPGSFNLGAGGTITMDVPLADVGSPALGATLTDTFADSRAEAQVAQTGLILGPTDLAPSRDYGADAVLGGTCPAVTASPAPSVTGQSVTFTAHVLTTAQAVPTGTVDFIDTTTNTDLGSAPLDGTGTASVTAALATAGTHAIAAQYSGDSAHAPGSGTVSEVVQPAGTATAVTVDHDPSVSGQAITFTATVSVPAPGAGTPAGQVQFLDGAQVLGARALSGGSAALTLALAATGTHAITAVYSGSPDYDASTSAVLTQTVDQASTSSSLTASPAESTYGQQVGVFDLVQAVQPGSGTPSGTVTFLEDGSYVGSAALSGDAASFTLPLSTVGTHTVTAQYGGDADFKAGTATTSIKVDRAPAPPALAFSPDPAVTGQRVTITVSVPAVSGGATPTGTVALSDGAQSLGTVTLAGGSGSLSTSFATAATHQVTAAYSGDAEYGPGSTTAGEVVQRAATATSLTSSATSSTYGKSVTLTAHVTVPAPGAGTPTGSVVFYDGQAVLGTGSLSDGTATLATKTIAGGKQSLTAAYQGDANFAASTSAAVTVTVAKASTSTALASSANPSNAGQAVTYTATVTGVSGAAAPSGTVTFFDGGARIGTATLSGGVARLTVTYSAAGKHSITATYGGDGNYLGSTSGVVKQTVR